LRHHRQPVEEGGGEKEGQLRKGEEGDEGSHPKRRKKL